ncbi:hypothetical protein G6F56_013246 [Rhizopus delemar]|nr:hypothetical protein G6F56_013246 [Rhizopus delemar]
MYLQKLNRVNKPHPLVTKKEENLGSGITHINGSTPRKNIYCSQLSYQRTCHWVSRQSLDLSSPPPLSPTNTWINTSISSSSDDDDDIPLSSLCATFNVSLLIDEEEEGDDELVPIACLNETPLLSAAEKYKAKVKARLQL